MGGGMDGMGMGGMMMWMLVWLLAGLALLVAVVVGVVWWLRRDRRSGQESNRSADSPEEILKRRYATGEIDEDEYLRRSAGLR